MLQLAENKRERHPQIAKKFKNAVFASASLLEDGLPLFRSFLAAPTAAITPAVNTSAAPQIGVLRPPMLPCCQRYQPAISGVACTRVGRGERQ
jgi:hypothetical protein